MSLGIAIGVEILLWLVSLKTRDATLADVWWGLGFATIAVASYIHSAGVGVESRRLLLMALTVIWGARLAIYIYARSHGKPEDHRYAAYRKAAGPDTARVMFRKVFGIQGLMMWITSIPVQVGMFLVQPETLGVWAAIGAAVWLIGFVIETVADWQMTIFKRDPANRGKPLATGVWRYTRHPNYFGDAMVWWGLFLITCDNPVAWLFIFAPIRMHYRLAYRQSLKLLEKNIGTTKPEYAHYVATTNRFYPWFPRKSAPAARQQGGYAGPGQTPPG